MPLATFDDLNSWMPTIKALQQVAKVVGRVQATMIPARHNALHLPLGPCPEGLMTQPLPDDRRIRLSFGDASIHLDESSGCSVADLTQLSQLTLLRFIKERFDLREVSKEETVSETDMLSGIDLQVAKDYAAAQYAAFTGIARFRARLEGHFSPVVVWPHHMDISTLVFHPDNITLDEGKAHLNFGFAPFTDGQYERPYLYAYASPYPDGFQPPPLPAPLTWNLEGWTGIVVSIDEIAKHDDEALYIETLCMQMHDALMPLLG